MVRRRRGSSPLARGLQSGHEELHSYSGIIPARAGFTAAADRHHPAEEDHPRSRGVYAESTKWAMMNPGSSPLARGLPLGRLRGEIEIGIIPARAGFTYGMISFIFTRRDHPRSRGVYSAELVTVRRTEGSSPLARGLLEIVVPGLGRIAPVDHPRSRGVYSTTISIPFIRGGSSPLARGLR